MNNESQPQFDAENAPAFDRLRDRRRAKRRRVLRVALTLFVCAALLGGAAYYAHRQIVTPYLDTPITSGGTDAPAEPEPAKPEPEKVSETAPAGGKMSQNDIEALLNSMKEEASR